MSPKPYSEYKDSGIEWLRELPNHWSINKVGRISKFIVGWTPPTGTSAFFDGDNKWANISDLGPRTISDTAKRISDSAVRLSRLKISPAGSLLFSFKLSVGAVSFAGVDLYTNEAIATFFETSSVYLRYAYYAYPLFIVENAGENIYGAKILNQERISSAKIALPPREEQLAIANYLDRETAEIDAFIADQEQLIALLAERRAATITQAVTKGLNPDAPMKVTGNDWFSEIPVHWSMMKGSLAASLIQTGPFGSQVHAHDYVDDGIPLINPQHIVDGRIVPNSHKGVTSDKAIELDRHRLRIGDVVVARRGELGRSAVVSRKDAGALCGTGSLLIRLRADSYDATYFQLVFSSDQNRAALSQASIGATMDNLSAGTIISSKFPAPPLDEQRQIVDYIVHEIEEIDAAITDAREAITLSKERRAAVISAAVSGKIDVRSLVGPATNDVEGVSIGVA
ncbi:restriction endonuclease subunit S [Glutamicibacter creatinolyticus]|uniref:restriction endonuclease subunit S n=1 Tax=Glutamicibacter creatinolyticus TaxID=162496 RepID=UPI0033C65BC4